MTKFSDGEVAPFVIPSFVIRNSSSMSSRPSFTASPHSPWLRRADQGVVAVWAALALAALAAWSYAPAWRPDGWVRLEQTPPQRAEFLIDLNRAAWPELAQLPEVGETLARRIVASRAAEGPFSSPEVLPRVSGIGPIKLARIRPYLAPLTAPPTLTAGHPRR